MQLQRQQLGLLDRLFPILVLLCMVLGLALGKLAPKLGHLFEPLIPLGLFLMIYPTVVKVPFEALRRASAEWKPIALTLSLNYLINPLLLYVFGWLFLHRHPELWVGLILLGIAPCIGMVLVWADLSGADNALSVSLMIWNSIIQVFSVPFWIYLLVGAKVPVPAELVLQSTFLYLVLPIAIGSLTRQASLKRKGQEWFDNRLKPLLSKIQLTALLGTLVIMFALKGEAILDSPVLIAYMVLPLTLFFGMLFFVGYGLSRWAKLPKEKAVAVAFNATGRNFELSIAIALSAFAHIPLVPISTVIGPLIEVPVMLSLVWIARNWIFSAP